MSEILPMFSAFLCDVERVLCRFFKFIEWICVNGTRKFILSFLGVLEFVSSFRVCGSDLVEISDWHAASKYFGSLISFFTTLKLTSTIASHV